MNNTTYFAVILAEGREHFTTNPMDQGVVTEYHGHLHPSFWGHDTGKSFVISVDESDAEKLTEIMDDDDAVFYYCRVARNVLDQTIAWSE